MTNKRSSSIEPPAKRRKTEAKSLCLYCLDLIDDEKENSIQCDVCHGWVTFSCAGLTDGDEIHERFVCRQCAVRKIELNHCDKSKCQVLNEFNQVIEEYSDLGNHPSGTNSFKNELVDEFSDLVMEPSRIKFENLNERDNDKKSIKSECGTHPESKTSSPLRKVRKKRSKDNRNNDSIKNVKSSPKTSNRNQFRADQSSSSTKGINSPQEMYVQIQETISKLVERNDGEKNDTPNKKPKWGTMIPLIGGSALGCQKATGTLPSFHLTYTDFKAHQVPLDKFWPGVDTFCIDEESPSSYGQVDFINSVCPCAGLSMLNCNTDKVSAKSRGSHATQNKWMRESAEYVLKNVKPKVLWGENAHGLFTNTGEELVQMLRGIGKKHGYSFSLVKTNTELHGLPQNRIRCFYFFWNSETVPQLSWKRRECKDLMSFLAEIPKNASCQDMFMLEGKASERFRPYQYVLEKEGLTHAEFAKKYSKKQKNFTICKYLVENDLLDDCIEWMKKRYPDEKFSLTMDLSKSKAHSWRTYVHLLENIKYKLQIGKGYWDDSPKFFNNILPTLMRKTMFTVVHPLEDRFLNAREMLHFMGLPHHFEIEDAKNMNHIAQNVPVNTARDWAEEVRKFCEGKLELTENCFMKQDNIKREIVCEESLRNQLEDNVINMLKKDETMDVKGKEELISRILKCQKERDTCAVKKKGKEKVRRNELSSRQKGMKSGLASRHGLQVHGMPPWEMKSRGLKFCEDKRKQTLIMYSCPYDRCTFQTDLQGIKSGLAAKHSMDMHKMRLPFSRVNLTIDNEGEKMVVESNDQISELKNPSSSERRSLPSAEEVLECLRSTSGDENMRESVNKEGGSLFPDCTQTDLDDIFWSDPSCDATTEDEMRDATTEDEMRLFLTPSPTHNKEPPSCGELPSSSTPRSEELSSPSTLRSATVISSSVLSSEDLTLSSISTTNLPSSKSSSYPSRKISGDVGSEGVTGDPGCSNIVKEQSFQMINDHIKTKEHKLQNKAELTDNSPKSKNQKPTRSTRGIRQPDYRSLSGLKVAPKRTSDEMKMNSSGVKVATESKDEKSPRIATKSSKMVKTSINEVKKEKIVGVKIKKVLDDSTSIMNDVLKLKSSVDCQLDSNSVPITTVKYDRPKVTESSVKSRLRQKRSEKEQVPKNILEEKSNEQEQVPKTTKEQVPKTTKEQVPKNALEEAWTAQVQKYFDGKLCFLNQFRKDLENMRNLTDMVCRREKLKKTSIKLHQEVLEKKLHLLLNEPPKPDKPSSSKAVQNKRTNPEKKNIQKMTGSKVRRFIIKYDTSIKRKLRSRQKVNFKKPLVMKPKSKVRLSSRNVLNKNVKQETTPVELDEDTPAQLKSKENESAEKDNLQPVLDEGLNLKPNQEFDVSTVQEINGSENLHHHSDFSNDAYEPQISQNHLDDEDINSEDVPCCEDGTSEPVSNVQEDLEDMAFKCPIENIEEIASNPDIQNKNKAETSTQDIHNEKKDFISNLDSDLMVSIVEPNCYQHNNVGTSILPCRTKVEDLGFKSVNINDKEGIGNPAQKLGNDNNTESDPSHHDSDKNTENTDTPHIDNYDSKENIPLITDLDIKENATLKPTEHNKNDEASITEIHDTDAVTLSDSISNKEVVILQSVNNVGVTLIPEVHNKEEVISVSDVLSKENLSAIQDTCYIMEDEVSNNNDKVSSDVNRPQDSISPPVDGDCLWSNWNLWHGDDEDNSDDNGLKTECKDTEKKKVLSIKKEKWMFSAPSKQIASCNRGVHNINAKSTIKNEKESTSINQPEMVAEKKVEQPGTIAAKKDDQPETIAAKKVEKPGTVATNKDDRHFCMFCGVSLAKSYFSTHMKNKHPVFMKYQKLNEKESKLRSMNLKTNVISKGKTKSSTGSTKLNSKSFKAKSGCSTINVKAKNKLSTGKMEGCPPKIMPNLKPLKEKGVCQQSKTELKIKPSKAKSKFSSIGTKSDIISNPEGREFKRPRQFCDTCKAWISKPSFARHVKLKH